MDTRLFIPEWSSNRDKEPDAQIVATIAPMTGGELRRLLITSMDSSGKPDIKKAQATIYGIVEKRVVELTNCADILDEPILNGKDVVERGEQGLLDELYAAITEASVLRAGLKKN